MAITFPAVFQSTVADDPAALAASYLTPSRFNSGCSVAGLGTNQLLYSTGATALAQSANLTYDGTTLTNGAGNISASTGFLAPTTSAGTNPGYGVIGNANYGMNINTGVGIVSFTINTTGSAAIGTAGFIIRSTSLFAFSNQASVLNSNTIDGGFSRLGPASVALGNGTATDFSGRLKLTSAITAAVAVTSLNASPTIGEVQTVNDALVVTAKGATVANGGTAVCQVMWNGSNWVGI